MRSACHGGRDPAAAQARAAGGGASERGGGCRPWRPTRRVRWCPARTRPGRRTSLSCGWVPQPPAARLRPGSRWRMPKNSTHRRQRPPFLRCLGQKINHRLHPGRIAPAW
ncbi:hypothetical protein DBR23_25255 [Acidovorax sp. HMWF018]|nr:hypothetical protein DBR23_25255 [Acidovorax sp. HMWF018]